MLAATIDDRSLALLRRVILATDRRHVVPLARAAHERRRLRPGLFFLIATLRRTMREKLQSKSSGGEIIDRHAPGHIDHLHQWISGKRPAVMHDHDRRHVRDLAMPFGARLGTFAAR